jgi:hypothetical protein
VNLTRAQARRLGIPWPSEARGRPAHVRSVMNATESRFAEGLEARRLAGEIRAWSFEAETLALGPGVVYVPDFRVDCLDGSTEFYEIKGGWARRDASAAGIVKVKWAAQRHPESRFYLCRWRRGNWVIKRIDGETVKEDQ